MFDRSSIPLTLAQLHGQTPLPSPQNLDLSTDLAPVHACEELVLEVSSCRHWKLEKQWLLEALRQRFGSKMENLVSVGRERDGLALRVMGKAVERGLESVHKHVLMSQLRDTVKAMCSDNETTGN